MKKGYYAFLVFSLIFDVLFFVFCIVSLFSGSGSAIEWIFYIFVDLTVGFPGTIRLFKKYRAVEPVQSDMAEDITDKK